MFYDLGNLSFDEDLRRYVYEEFCCGDRGFLDSWMMEALVAPYQVTTPTLISEVRYAECKHDPKAMEDRVLQVVILGLSESSEYDQMRSPDHLESGEIKIEFTEGPMGADITITLVEDLHQSMRVLSSLRLFAEQLTHPRAA